MMRTVNPFLWFGPNKLSFIVSFCANFMAQPNCGPSSIICEHQRNISVNHSLCLLVSSFHFRLQIPTGAFTQIKRVSSFFDLQTLTFHATGFINIAFSNYHLHKYRAISFFIHHFLYASTNYEKKINFGDKKGMQ